MKFTIIAFCSLFFLSLLVEQTVAAASAPVRIVVKSTSENSLITFSVTLSSGAGQKTSFTVQDTSFTMETQMNGFECTIEKKTGDGELEVEVFTWCFEQWRSSVLGSADSVVIKQSIGGEMSIETFAR